MFLIVVPMKFSICSISQWTCTNGDDAALGYKSIPQL